jgi:hypothetical protein
MLLENSSIVWISLGSVLAYCLVKLVLGLVIVGRARQSDLAAIARALGTWFRKS